MTHNPKVLPAAANTKSLGSCRHSQVQQLCLSHCLTILTPENWRVLFLGWVGGVGEVLSILQQPRLLPQGTMAVPRWVSVLAWSPMGRSSFLCGVWCLVSVPRPWSAVLSLRPMWKLHLLFNSAVRFPISPGRFRLSPLSGKG